MATWVLLNRPYLPPNLTSSWLRNIMINVFLIVIISMIPGVSAMGHFAGGVAGAVLGIPLIYSRYGHGLQRWLGLAGALAIPLACLGVAFGSVTVDERERAVAIDVQKLMRVPYNDHALPLLKKETDSLFDDAAAVREAIRVFDQAGADLKRLAASLAALSSSSERVARKIETVKNLVSGWSRFFETFQQVLERRIPWTEEKRDELKEMGNELVERSNRL
jgi:hypothetical protein